MPQYNTNPIATIKNKMKPKEAVIMRRTKGRTRSSDIVPAAGGYGEGDRMCGFLFTQLNPDTKRARRRPVDLAQSV